MALPGDLPETVLLLPSAADDLTRILRRNHQEFSRVWDDLVRLGKGTLPPQGKKKLISMDAFRFDSGRYQLVFSRRQTSCVVWAVSANPEQKDLLKRFR